MVEPIVLSHVALLLPDVERAGRLFAMRDLKVGGPEIWEGEGTKEIYVGDYATQSALPLLMEATREGVYSRALAKRGPGIHHIAIDVQDLESYIFDLAGSGWLLHPKSLRMIRESQTAYLARPGMPTLIEVQQREKLSTNLPLIEEVHLNIDEHQMKMMHSLGLLQIRRNINAGLVIKKEKLNLADLIAK